MKNSSKHVKKMNSMIEDCAWGSLVLHHESTEDVRNSVKSIIEEPGCVITGYYIGSRTQN